MRARGFSSYPEHLRGIGWSHHKLARSACSNLHLLAHLVFRDDVNPSELMSLGVMTCCIILGVIDLQHHLENIKGLACHSPVARFPAPHIPKPRGCVRVLAIAITVKEPRRSACPGANSSKAARKKSPSSQLTQPMDSQGATGTRRSRGTRVPHSSTRNAAVLQLFCRCPGFTQVTCSWVSTCPRTAGSVKNTSFSKTLNQSTARVAHWHNTYSAQRRTSIVQRS